VSTKEELRKVVAKQSVLCGAITAVVRVLKQEHVAMLAPQIMETVFAIFRAGTGAEAEVQEDGLMLIGALVEQLGAQFEPYLAAVKPFVAAGVQNTGAAETCNICIGLMGDIARSMGAVVTPHCDEFMTALLTILKIPTLAPSLKPTVLSTCGDIATGIGGDAFGKYFQFVMAALQESSIAAAKDVSNEDYDTIDAQNDLRDACLETYTSIFMALKGDGPTPHQNVSHMMPVVPHIIQFITECMKDPEVSERFIRDAAGIVGDFIEVYQVQVKPILPVPFCVALVKKAMDSENTKQTKRNGQFAAGYLKKIGIHAM
jgi:importin subunit beta-1